MNSALEVSNFFLKYAAEHGDLLTNLKLQKLVYYAQAWHLALFGKPLFKEDFEAWVHGPVIPSLYRHFKKYGFNPIKVSQDHREPNFESRGRKLLEEVYLKYACLEAFQLEILTHQEDPWKVARGNLSPDEPCSKIISTASMKTFYSNVKNT